MYSFCSVLQITLGMDQNLAKQYEDLLLEDDRLDRIHLRRGHRECSQHEILRPGFTRLNLPWFSTDEEIDFVIDALEFVANHGWKFMPQYIFNNETGEWHHHTNQVFKVWNKHIFGLYSYRKTDLNGRSETTFISCKNGIGIFL